MPFKEGQSGNPAGRKAGVPNRFTATVKETVLEVFKEAQDDPELCLMTFLKKNPRDFYAIASKLIPLDVRNEIKIPEGIKLVFSLDPECKPLEDDRTAD